MEVFITVGAIALFIFVVLVWGLVTLFDFED